MPLSERGNTLLRRLDKWFGIPLVALLGALRQRRSRPERVETIGILALGPAGDFLLSVGLSVPVLRQAFPGCHITVFATASNRSATPLVPGTDEYVILPLKDILAGLRMVREREFDLLIDFGPWPRISALLARLARARFTVGFRTPRQYRHPVFDCVADHRNDRHEVENYAALLQAIGLDATRLPPRLSIPADAQHKINDMDLGRYIVCHPWAAGFRKEMREWPETHWRQLTARLVAEGYRVVFSGGPSDRDASTALLCGLDGTGTEILDMAGQLSLSETAALISGAAGVVSVNTGVMHLTAALDVPMVALHGPTNPLRWGPLSEQAVVLIPDADNVAYLNLGFEYPESVAPCMHLLTVDEVATALRRALDASPAHTRSIEIAK